MSESNQTTLYSKLKFLLQFSSVKNKVKKSSVLSKAQVHREKFFFPSIFALPSLLVFYCFFLIYNLCFGFQSNKIIKTYMSSLSYAMNSLLLYEYTFAWKKPQKLFETAWTLG